MNKTPERFDIVIVGAGFTGLTAAHELRGAGLSVLLLEAEECVGGRVRSAVLPRAGRIDAGGQFICDDMLQVMDLARRHAKTLVTTWFEGMPVVRPPMPKGEADRVYARSFALREDMLAIDPRAPAISGLSVDGWLAGVDEPVEVTAAFRAMAEGLWCLPASDIPLWYLIDNDRRITNETPELQYFLAETMHSLAEDLTVDLGGALRCSTHVHAVRTTHTGVSVETEAGTFQACQALLAMPPSSAAQLAFDPALPEDLDAALSVWRGGVVIKIVCAYATPFWRDAGLSGMVLWNQPQGLFACDFSRPDQAMLGFFIAGPLAIEMRGSDDATLLDEARRRLIDAHGPKAGDWIDAAVFRWTGGDHMSGYSDLNMDPHVNDAEARILTGAPPIHFACSEVSPSFPGYVEGAITAGKAVAARILAAHPADERLLPG